MNHSEIVIQGDKFSAPCPYAAGHVLTEVEASVLNQTYHENLRNNFATKMKAAKEDGKALTADDFATYAAQYAFGVRQPGIAREYDPVKSEAKRLAWTAIMAKLKEKGHKIKDLQEGQRDKLIENALAKYPRFLEEAAKVVAARKTAADAVTELDLG